MKQFNWGHGIFIFYVLFVGILVTAVIASTKVDRSLVLDDYYSLDLAYQSRYDEIENGLKDNSISIDYIASEDQVVIQSENPIEGQVTFYRPSNKSLDFSQSIGINSTTINTEKMEAGFWIIKLRYTLNNKDYYKEQKLYIV